MPDMEALQDMKNMDIMQVDREQLIDIGDIRIDSGKTAKGRLQDYMEQVHNPFFVKSGEYILKFQYADSGRSMEELMMEYVSKMARIRYEEALQEERR